MEEETDDLENIVAGLLHVEGEGVAAVPDLDEGETLKEVLDGQEGRTQHLPPRTLSAVVFISAFLSGAARQPTDSRFDISSKYSI